MAWVIFSCDIQWYGGFLATHPTEPQKRIGILRLVYDKISIELGSIIPYIYPKQPGFFHCLILKNAPQSQNWIIFPPVSREQKYNLGHMLKAHLGHIGTYWKHILYLHSLPAWAVFEILSNFPKIPIGAWLMTGSFTSNPWTTKVLHSVKTNTSPL